MFARLLMILLAAFAGWWSRNRGLSREKATEFLKNLFDNAGKFGEKGEAQLRELIAASAHGGEEAYRAIDKWVSSIIHSSLDSVREILDEIRHEFETVGVRKDDLHLLRVDDSEESRQAQELLGGYGIIYRVIDPSSDLHSVIYRKVAPPSLIDPKNRLYIGLKAIRVYLEGEDEENGEGEPAAAATSASAPGNAAAGSANGK